MSGDGDDDARALSREDLVYKAKLAEQAERCVRARTRGARDRARARSRDRACVATRARRGGRAVWVRVDDVDVFVHARWFRWGRVRRRAWGRGAGAAATGAGDRRDDANDGLTDGSRRARDEPGMKR